MQEASAIAASKARPPVVAQSLCARSSWKLFTADVSVRLRSIPLSLRDGGTSVP